jgi:hypothetical protein
MFLPRQPLRSADTTGTIVLRMRKSIALHSSLLAAGHGEPHFFALGLRILLLQVLYVYEGCSIQELLGLKVAILSIGSGHLALIAIKAVFIRRTSSAKL